MFLKVKKLSKNATLPLQASFGAAGYDLSSAKDLIVPAHGKALIPIDLSFSFPEGVYGRIAPRSGLAWKHHLDVGAGVIDSDYRGLVGIVLFNHSTQDFKISVGDRVAQIILEQYKMFPIQEVDELTSTSHGDKGFGSTDQIQPKKSCFEQSCEYLFFLALFICLAVFLICISKVSVSIIELS